MHAPRNRDSSEGGDVAGETGLDVLSSQTSTGLKSTPHTAYRITGIRRYSRVPQPPFPSGAKPHRSPLHLPEALG